MKKIIALMLVFGMLFGGVANAAAPKEKKPVEVYIDGERIPFSVQPIIESGATLVPFRPIFEKMGLKVDWDAKTRTVTGTKQTENGEFKIKLIVGSQKAEVSPNKVINLQVAPRIINGSTMIPLRFVGEASSYKVFWDPAGIVTLKNAPTGNLELNGTVYNVFQQAADIRIGISNFIGESDRSQNMYKIVFFNDGTKDLDLTRTSIFARLTTNLNIMENNGPNYTLGEAGELFKDETIVKPGNYYESIVVFSQRHEWDAISIGRDIPVAMPKSE